VALSQIAPEPEPSPGPYIALDPIADTRSARSLLRHALQPTPKRLHIPMQTPLRQPPRRTLTTQ